MHLTFLFLYLLINLLFSDHFVFEVKKFYSDSQCCLFSFCSHVRSLVNFFGILKFSSACFNIHSRWNIILEKRLPYFYASFKTDSINFKQYYHLKIYWKYRLLSSILKIHFFFMELLHQRDFIFYCIFNQHPSVDFSWCILSPWDKNIYWCNANHIIMAKGSQMISLFDQFIQSTFNWCYSSLYFTHSSSRSWIDRL